MSSKFCNSQKKKTNEEKTIKKENNKRRDNWQDIIAEKKTYFMIYFGTHISTEAR